MKSIFLIALIGLAIFSQTHASFFDDLSPSEDMSPSECATVEESLMDIDTTRDYIDTTFDMIKRTQMMEEMFEDSQKPDNKSKNCTDRAIDKYGRFVACAHEVSVAVYDIWRAVDIVRHGGMKCPKARPWVFVLVGHFFNRVGKAMMICGAKHRCK